MSIKQELINIINEHDAEGKDCTLSVEQIEAIVSMIDDSAAKDNMIEDLKIRLKSKDDLISKLYGGIINNFLKENL